MTHAATSAVYRRMAEQQLRDVSPSYENLCLEVSADGAVLDLLQQLPELKRQPNLLLAAVRFLGGPVMSWSDFRAFLVERWPEVSNTMRHRRTQTNEPGRCATVLPALCATGRPLALFEAGASAGLCLFPERYSYRYRTSSGDHVLGSGPELSCMVTGPAPLPNDLPEVVWRGGLDLNPLDLRNADDVHWLESLVWPEQADRLSTLTAAIEIVRAEQPAVVTGDLTRDLEAATDSAPSEALLVIFHSAVLAYVDAEGREDFRAELRRIAARRPVLWLANEAPGIVADIPGHNEGGPARFVLTRNGEALARTGPHGDSLDWLGRTA